MANAGGAWDNAKKVVETELRAKGTPLHDACVVGDTVGDPFKDTSSVALNPIIKFTTLFGLLAVSLAVDLTSKQGAMIDQHPGRDLLRDLGVLRPPQLLRHAHRKPVAAFGGRNFASDSPPPVPLLTKDNFRPPRFPGSIQLESLWFLASR